MKQKKMARKLSAKCSNSIEKKPNATECSDFRTINFLTHAAIVLIRILTKRIEAKVEGIGYTADDQFGFRRNKKTRDAIAELRVLGREVFNMERISMYVLMTMKRFLIG